MAAQDCDVLQTALAALRVIEINAYYEGMGDGVESQAMHAADRAVDQVRAAVERLSTALLTAHPELRSGLACLALNPFSSWSTYREQLQRAIDGLAD